MGTSCNVGRLNADGTVTFIMVNYDGYLTGVGAMLVKHWTDPEKVDALMNLGDVSTLGEEVGEKQDFDKPTNRTWCRAYGRDRGEDGVECQTVPEDTFWQGGLVYLFRDGQWWRKPEKTVVDALAVKISNPDGDEDEDEDD